MAHPIFLQSKFSAFKGEVCQMYSINHFYNIKSERSIHLSFFQYAILKNGLCRLYKAPIKEGRIKLREMEYKINSTDFKLNEDNS